MSEISELIAKYCSGSVEFKALGDVGTFVRGNGLPKNCLTDEGVGAIHYGQVFTTYGTSTAVTKSFTTHDLAKKLRRAKPGDLVIATTSENEEDVCKAVAWVGSEEIVISGDAYVYSHNLDPLYMAYFFQADPFQSQKRRFITGTKVKRVSGTDLARIKVPVPDLRAQRKIAEVLSKMESLQAGLQAELQAELQARSRQYEHYRDQLVTPVGREGVRWAPMGEVGTFFRGRRFTKNDMVVAGIEAIHYGEIYTDYGVATAKTVSCVRKEMESQLRFARPGDVVIAGVGETVEDVGKAVAWLGAGEVAIHDDTFAYRHDMNPKFVSYYLQTAAFHAQKERHVSRAKVKRLSGGGLAQVQIPLLLPDEQDRAVAILDRFGALIGDLSVSLPAEIEARGKQYEYYRDKLLTFEERVA